MTQEGHSSGIRALPQTPECVHEQMRSSDGNFHWSHVEGFEDKLHEMNLHTIGYGRVSKGLDRSTGLLPITRLIIEASTRRVGHRLG